MTKFCLHPGEVKSLHDGDIHHIGFRQLVNCYRLDPRQCVMADERYHHPEHDGLICLYPRINGDYAERLKQVNS